jgi:mono/diheme cytochrome c family protein
MALLGAAFGTAVSGCHRHSSLTPLQAQGKQVFDVGCAHCHVENTQHLKPAPPDLRGLFAHTDMPDGQPATDARVEQLLMTGKGSMPSFAYQMTPQQITAVIAYLHVYGAAPHE